MQRIIFLLLLLILASPSSWAASHAKRPVTHKKAPVHKTEQVPFSFLPPRLPNATLQHIQTPLTGRVVQQQANTSTLNQPIRPQYTQIFLVSPQPEAQKTVPIAARSRSSRHLALHWFQFAPKERALPVDYPERSWVEDLSLDQAKTLASAITQTVSQQIPPETTTLLLATTPKNQSKNPLPSLFNDELRKAGFALVERRSQAVNAQLIQYQVSRFNDGLWVKLRLPHSETNQFYQLNFANQPVASTGLTVRSISEEGGMK